MSLRANTIANYVGQGYTTLIGILMLPFYLQYLGVEAYGLLGLFAVIQGWLIILDMGLTPTLARQIAYERGKGRNTLGNISNLLRSIEIIIITLAALTFIVIWQSSAWIASDWLNVDMLSHSEVTYCVTLIGLTISFQWVASLYRSGIQGLEMMVWLNISKIFVATFRYGFAYILLRWITQIPHHFFEFQVAISLIELLIYCIKFYTSLPSHDTLKIRFSYDAIKPVMPFTLSVAYSSMLWVFLTQLDKLILSHALSLKEYGYFALVMVVSNGLLTLTNPLKQAILPRMTLLLSQGDSKKMLLLYRNATQLMLVVILPITATIALYSKQLLYAWTGNMEAAEWAGPVLTWFILGNAIMAISSFQYHLQVAHGKLRIHVINSTVTGLIQVPILVYVAFNYGAQGVAYSWFAIRLLSFAIWPAIVHRQYAPGIHKKWLFSDIFPGVLATIILSSVIYNIDKYIHLETKIEIIMFLVATSASFAVANISVCSPCRKFIFRNISTQAS